MSLLWNGKIESWMVKVLHGTKDAEKEPLLLKVYIRTCDFFF